MNTVIGALLVLGGITLAALERFRYRNPPPQPPAPVLPPIRVLRGIYDQEEGA